MQPYINHIAMTHFRNHKLFHKDITSFCTFILGANGSGKTSILEAISMFMPGKGFRAKNISEVIRHDKAPEQLCQVCLSINDDCNTDLLCSIEHTKHLKAVGNKKLHVNLNIIAIYPELDSLFIGSPSDRRRFFDNIVYCFIKEHSKHCAQYKYYVKSRLHLLKQRNYDGMWVNKIENALAKLTLQIESARNIVIDILNKNMRELGGNFCHSVISLQSQISVLRDADTNAHESHTQDEYNAAKAASETLHSASAASQIEYIQQQFSANRDKDIMSGMTNFGPHRSDFIMKINDLPAAQSSTGEQKKALLNMILSKAKSLSNVCVLLDDVLAHLDQKMQHNILSTLQNIKAQIFLTSPDSEEYSNAAKILHNIDVWRL